MASEDEHALWTLLGSGRMRVAGDFQRLFEQLPSDTPLLPASVRREVRRVTDPRSLGHLQAVAWKETPS